jgi:hypothetical protein
MSSLLKMAVLARGQFNEHTLQRDLLKKLYKNYNPDVETESFIDKAAQIFPNLNCGIASVYLKHVLKKGKIVQGSYGSQNHTFLLIDKTIIDITADQYGGPSVYVGPLKYPWSLKPIRSII